MSPVGQGMTSIFKPARISQLAKRVASTVTQRLRFSKLLRRNEDSIEFEEFVRRSELQPPVFVYQMGKVASTSIFESLNRQYDGKVLHAHTFGAFHASADVRALYRYHQSTSSPIKIITLVREPVTRNLSAFFQNFRRDTGQSVEECDLSAVELKRKFMSNYPHEIPLVWFDNNLRKHFQIDVYDYPFPDCGHLRMSNQQVEVLLMRHDLANSLKEELVGEFVDLKEFQLKDYNVGAEKQYAHLYAKLQQAKLPLKHLYYLASSKYMHHFFHSDMREIIYSWSDEPINNNKAG